MPSHNPILMEAKPGCSGNHQRKQNAGTPTRVTRHADAPGHNQSIDRPRQRALSEFVVFILRGRHDVDVVKIDDTPG